MTNVILLERIRGLGLIGDQVTVKPGFARNFLLPQKKALRVTKDNLAFFEAQKAQFEAKNIEMKKEAEAIAAKMDTLSIDVIRQAGNTGQLYGSVSTRDIAVGVSDAGFTIERGQVVLNHAIKTLGITPVEVALHGDVSVEILVNVAKTDAEAETQLAEYKAEKNPAAAQPDNIKATVITAETPQPDTM
jgi:large subunit ribosomal protein L9